MKRIGKPVFFIVVLFIALLTYSAFFGISTTYGDFTKPIIKGAGEIRWGIDIRGGVDVTFSPPDGVDATDEQMDAATSVIKLRLLSQNITDSEVYTDKNRDRIIVRFPWKENETDFDPEKAIQELGATAMLTFREGVETDAAGNPSGVTADTIILQGQDVKSATVGYQQNNEIVVQLKLNDSGKQSFAEATARLAGTAVPISIWMDEEMISAPTVNNAIVDGEAIITGGFTSEEANALAEKINGGALPFKLQTENFNTLSPTLGIGAKDAMVMAGFIAFGLIAIFMIIIYRLPGFVAVIALVAQVAGTIAAITGFIPTIPSFTLTLPGIAGIILSMGMAVDANVLIFERFKEEVRAGKTLRSAMDNGFNRAFGTIFDSNVTTLFVAVVLFYLGTGPIKGFAVTLAIGLILSMFTAITVTKFMLKSLINSNVIKNSKFFGA